MNLKPLSDSLLLSKTKSLVQSERQLLTGILHHLREVERRKLFSDLGYSSLFAYAVHELGYSEGQAGRRIQAMRILRELPQLEEKIESGTLNLSHLSQAQSYFREAKKAEKAIEPAAKLEIIERLESKSAREAQKILLELGPKLVIPKERERALTPELSEVRFVMSEEIKEKLERVKALLGPKALGLGFAELIALMAEYTEETLMKRKFGPHLGKGKEASSNKSSIIPLKAQGSVPETQSQFGQGVDTGSSSSNVGGHTRADNRNRHSSGRSKLVAEAVNNQAVTKHPRPSKSFRYIPRSVKAVVWLRDQGQCSQCGSRRNLNFDHIQPLALGGESTASNLRLLCFHCNQRARMKTFGPRGAEALARPPKF